MKRDLIKKVQDREAAIQVNPLKMRMSAKSRAKLTEVIEAVFPDTMMFPEGIASFYFADERDHRLWDYSQLDRGLDGMEKIQLDDFFTDEL